MSNPASWQHRELNAEAFDPAVDITNAQGTLPEGFARYSIMSDPESIDYGPFPRFHHTTESGNLVGEPRVIEGEYDVSIPRWSYLGPRIVSQGGHESRTDYLWSHYTNNDPQFPLKEIRRLDPSNPGLDPNVPMAGDVVVTHYFTGPTGTPNPMAQHSLSSISYAGGDNGDTSVPTYSVNTNYMYAQLESSSYDGYDWLSTDSDTHESGVITSGRDPAGFLTIETYDQLDRLTAITPPAPELPVSITYGTSLATYVDNYSSTEQEHLYASSTTVSKGSVGQSDYEETYVEYDGYGKPTKRRRLAFDGSYREQDRVYDSMGRLVFASEWHESTEPSPPGTTLSYTDPAGEHDPFGRVSKIMFADASVSEFGYSGLTFSTTVSDISGFPQGSTFTTTQYRDYKNRIRIVDSPAGADAVYSYDHLGNLTEVRLVDEVVFDNWNPDPSIPSLEIDRFRIANVGGQVRSFSYDALGRLKTSTQPESGNTSYDSYDALGKLLDATDDDGNVIRNSYDLASRLIQVEVKRPQDTSFVLSSRIIYANTPAEASGFGAGALSNPIQFEAYEDGNSNPIHVRSLIYDGLNGRVGSERNNFAFWTNNPNADVDTQYSYDESGRIEEFSYPLVSGSGRMPTKVRYTYSHGHITGIDANRADQDPNIFSPLITAVSYDPSGRYTALEFSNGIIETTSRDEQYRIEQQVVKLGTEELWDSGIYAYDGVSNISAIGQQEYEYDSIGRLTAANTVGPDGASLYHQDYS